MDIPQPPRDTSLRNIIDKLAEFVARNGPEFEQITKAKQKGNPKFEFLYGGEFYNYYQYRVASEQNFLKQQASISQAQVQQVQQQQQHLSQSMQNVQQQPPVGYSNPNIQPGLWTNGSNGSSSSTNMTSQIEAINMQQNSLRDQIRQSEQNLSAQHGVLVQQQQKQIEEAITKAQNDTLQMQAEENNIRLPEFDAILQPIIESCTKDSISTGKNWILQHTSDTSKCNVVLQYLLKKALVNGSTFSQKLHLIYLVNDVLHHCVRKNANDLKACLENVVIPMFCSAEIIANDEQKAKLTKLLSLWESKAKFFDACVISKLRCPESSMQEYKTNLMNVHNNLVTQVTQATKAALESYKQQHQVFIQHATQQIATLETQKQALEQQVLAKVLPNAALIPPLMEQQIQIGQLPPQVTQRQQNNLNSNHGLHGNASSGNNNMQITNMQIPNNNQMMSPQPHPPPLMAQKITMPVTTSFNNSMNSSMGSNQLAPEPQILQQPQPPQQQPQQQQQQQQQQQPPQQQQQQQQQQQPLPPQDLQTHSHNLPQSASYSEISGPFQQQPPGQIPATLQYPQSIITSSSVSNAAGRGGEYTSPPPNFQIPDLSKPPPGFSQSSQSGGEEDVRPSIPYYELPAGLMVPLIRLEDYNYKPLNPDDVRLPPPAPSNERLSSAIIAFYSLPSHNRPRDVDGWEKLGLYEYYKVKNAARKQKEEEIASGKREKSRSPSPIYIEPVKPKKPNKRRYRSKSRSRSKSKSRSPRRSRTRSRTPERRNSRYTASRRSRSPKRSPVRERERDRDRDRERERERDRPSRERERERERSDSPPPSFFGGNYTKSNEFIEESNKGHQMLMKMGWGGSGTGLGIKGQGIDSPVSGGEVRDKKDLYKGVGINMNDPFENFRKNKGAAFIHRMRSRAEEKS